MARLIVRPDTRAGAKLARDARGHYTQGAFQAALRAAHKRMAEDVQSRAVRELRRRVKLTGRRQRSTRHLELAVAHRRNIVYHHDGFGVGVESWLYEQSPAKSYARRIEEGGPNPMAAVGRVSGFFWSGAGDSGARRPFTAPGRGFGQGRFAWWNTPGGFRISPVDAASEGYRMHTEAMASFLASRRALAVYKEEFKTRGMDFRTEFKGRHGRAPTNADVIR